MAEQVRLKIANNALLEVPIYEEHRRGSNWCAVIDIDGTAPGGLSRRWLPRGKGACFHLIESVVLFDPIEFGADYTTGTGRKRFNRWYGVVVAKTEDFLLVEQAKDGVAAVLLSKSKRLDKEAHKVALNAERQTLLDRAEKIQKELDSLTETGP